MLERKQKSEKQITMIVGKKIVLKIYQKIKTASFGGDVTFTINMKITGLWYQLNSLESCDTFRRVLREQTNFGGLSRKDVTQKTV